MSRAVLGGVGLGFRPELAADLLADPGVVDFVEVVAESVFVSAAARREARALAETWPVVPHGVKLSLGSADGIDPERARRLGALARELGARAVSEHVAMTRGGRREIGHLTAIPFTREAVRVVARNVARARRELPDVPLFLENIAWTFRWPDDEMSEGDFYTEIVEATGCDLLLDLANLYANATNAGVPADALLARHPLERVGMVHLAGGALVHGFYEDTHAHPLPPEVLALLERTLERTGALPVILERDGRFPPFSQIEGELAAARVLLAGARSRAAIAKRPASSGALDPDLAHRQEALAEILTRDPPPGCEAEPYGVAAIGRTRAILFEKRVDDAIPLLPSTRAEAGDELLELARRALAGTERAPLNAGIVDARRVAEALVAHPRFGEAAQRDAFELRVRFAGARPRLSPVLARETLKGGRSLWALKAPGTNAPIRIYERRGER